MRKLLLLAPVMLAACVAQDRRSEAPRPAPQRPAYRPPPAPRPVPSDAAYVATAASIDLLEIRSAELALQRSSNRRVRDFAEMMISAHQGTSAQLSFAGRRLNLLPSAKLMPRHQVLLDRLAAAPDMDLAYRQQQLGVHHEAWKLHSDYAARGTSPTLRPVAAAAAPVIARHLRLVRYL
jgi:putative membrane protein